MKKITYLGLASAALIFSASAYCKEMDAPPPKLGQPLELKFRAVDGREVDLSKLKGKIVLIDFWATWCGPCVAAIPHVKSAYEKFHDQGFEIIGISLDEQKEELTEFVEKKSLPWPQHFDGKGWENVFAKKYGITEAPTMWLVDRQGNLCDTKADKNLAVKIARLLGASNNPAVPSIPVERAGSDTDQKPGVAIEKVLTGDGKSAEIEALIQRLGNPDFNEREAATEALNKLGAAVLPALRDAKARCSDVEVLSRLNAILWENRPVTELISEFGKLRKEIAEVDAKRDKLNTDDDANGKEDTDNDDETVRDDEREKLKKRLNSLNDELAAMCDRILQRYPQAAETIDVLEYLLFEAYDIDGVRGQKACAILTEHHAGSKQAGRISYLLYKEHKKYPDAEFPSASHLEKLARAVINKSEHHESKGLASLTLAYALMSLADAPYVKADEQQKWLNESKDVLTTVVEKYGAINLPDLAKEESEDADEAEVRRISGDVAKKLLFEINALVPGKPAPQLEGAYLDGKVFKLDDLKGNVVVLHFWKFGEGEVFPDTPAIKDAPPLGMKGQPIVAPLTKMEGKPFVIISINGNDDLKALEELNRKQTTSLRFVDDIRGDDLPDISREWSVRRWPTTYVIDHKGVIRHKWVNASSERLMGKEIEDLVKEAEKQRNGKSAAKEMNEAQTTDIEAGKYIDDEEMTKKFYDTLSEFAAQGKCLAPATLHRKLHKTSCPVNLAPPANQVLTPEEVYEHCQRSVFLLGSVTGPGKDGKNFEKGCSATAFALTTDGVLLTSRHVFEEIGTDRFGAMNFKGEVFPVVDVLAVSREADLAVIRIDGKGFEPLPVAADAKVGAWVGVLSHPGGQYFTFTQGHVTRFTKSTADNIAEKWMAISAEYATGSSGAPILNRYGAVVGVATNTENIPQENDSGDKSDEENTGAPGLGVAKKEETSKGDEDATGMVPGTAQMIVKTTVPSQAILKFIHGVK